MRIRLPCRLFLACFLLPVTAAWSQEDALAKWRDDACRAVTQQAEQGDDQAKVNAGLINLGAHCPRNDREAARWFKLAADDGYPDGIYWLGMMYKAGTGVEQDVAKAFTLVKRAAKFRSGN